METSTKPAWWESDRRLPRSPGLQQPGTGPALSLVDALDFEGRTKDDGYGHSVDASTDLPTKLRRPSSLRGSRARVNLNSALPEGPKNDGASRSSSESQVSEANATVGADETWAEESTSDGGHKHRSSRREVKVDTVRKGDKIFTSGSTFFQPGDVLSSGGNSNVVNSSFSAKAGERPDADDPPFAEEATRGKVRSGGDGSGRRDKDSFRSETSKSTINNPKLLATVEDAIRRLILPELTAAKREQSKKGDLELRTRSSSGAQKVSETGSNPGSTPGLTGVRRKPPMRRSGDGSEVLGNYYASISPPAQDVLPSRSEVPNADRVKNMAFSAAGEGLKPPHRRRKYKEREAYKDKESEPSTSMVDLGPEPRSSLPYPSFSKAYSTASVPEKSMQSKIYPSSSKAHSKEPVNSRDDVTVQVENNPPEQEATEEKEELRRYRTKIRSKNDSLVESYEEHSHLHSPRDFERFEREISEDTINRDSDRFSRERKSDKQSGLGATAIGAALAAAALTAAAIHKDQSEDYIDEKKDRRRRRTKSRSKSLAESYEDHEHEPIPPIPLMSSINATGMSRSSILSAATDNPHSASQERDGYLAGTPGLNKEDMLSQEEVQGKRLNQENHEPRERYREYAVAAEPGRKYGDGDQDAADSHLKTSKDNKRRTVQVEYVAPRSRTQRGEPSLSDSEIGAVAGAGLSSLHHRDDYQKDPELVEDQDDDYYHQEPPPPLRYVPYGQGRRGLSPIPTVSYKDENQDGQHRKNGRSHGLDSDHSNTIRRLTPTQLEGSKSVQQNASDIASIPADGFLDGRARSRERKQNRSLSRGEALAAGAAAGLIAGEVAGKLKTPLRPRSSRSLSRERIVQRAVEKARGEKSELRRTHRSSRSRNEIYEGPVQERRSTRGQNSDPSWETVPRLSGVVKEAERSRENEPPRNEVAHSLHQTSGSHFSVSPSLKNDPSQHEVVGVDTEGAPGSLSRAETPRPIEWSINKELPPVPQRTLRRTANNTSAGVADVENGTYMRKIQRNDTLAGLSVRDERDRSVALGEGSIESKTENNELPIQTQTQGQENDSKLKIKDLRHHVGYTATSSPISPLSAIIESNNSSLSLTGYLQAHPKEVTSSPSAAKLPIPMDRLGDFFVPLVSPRCFKDSELQQISKLLRLGGRQAWSEIPRIYSVLRMIGHLETIDNFIDHGITDIWVPFSSTTLPQELSSGLQTQFLDVQACVFTKGLDLEKDKKKRHAHFGKNDALPFDVGNLLGGCRLSQVHRIVSLISKREYARKRLRRRAGSKDEAEIKSFKVELQVLKKIQHIHCVDLVASYTDSKWFCLIMSPVADSDLKAFYNLAANDSACLKILSSFYGCLASALTYLHNKQIRHRDIKPESILVKGDKVYLTDFGISLDWESLSGSTTTDDSGKTWLYCAPEVAYYQRRNSSSDIWSLGCVFLEMATVLAGLKIGDLQSYFREKKGNYRFYTNIDMIPGWVEKLRSSSTLEDATLLEWAMEMLQLDAAQRPTAAALYQSVGAMERFCGSCCEIEASSDGTVSDGEFWADAIENEDNVAPNCPTNPPAQNLVTPKDIRVDNPNTEERLPKEKVLIERDNNGYITSLIREIVTPIDTQADNPNTEERLPNSTPKPRELEVERDRNGVIVAVTTE